MAQDQLRWLDVKREQDNLNTMLRYVQTQKKIIEKTAVSIHVNNKSTDL